jgi:peptidoglycan-N-acetylglucosamine deacetylase
LKRQRLVAGTAVLLGAVLLLSLALPLGAAASSAPPAPRDLIGSARPDGKVALSWTASTGGAGGIRYRVFRDDTRVATVEKASYVDTPGRAGTFRYKVRAIDKNGVKSAFSATISVTVPEQVSPLAPPEGLTALTGEQGTARLSWEAVDGAVHYVVLRHGSRIGTTKSTSFEDWAAGRPGQEHSYGVRAVDAEGRLTAPSSVAKAAVVPELFAWTGRVIRHGSRAQPAVALTFDDCYATDNMREIVRILRAHKAAATFFCTGQAIRKAPAFYADLAREFPLANHTWSHPNLNKISRADVIDQLTRTTSRIESITGWAMTPMMRPPYGAANESRVAILAEMGLAVVRWDVDTVDYDAASTWTSVRNRALTAKNGSIVLMHDRRRTVRALPEIIKSLRARGYKLVTVNELLDIPWQK